MTAEAWVAVAIFVLTQFGALGVTVFILKGDTNVLRSQMLDMRETLKDLTKVVTIQAVQNNRLDSMEARQTSQGRRLDEATQRINRFVDIRAYPAVASERAREDDNN